MNEAVSLSFLERETLNRYPLYGHRKGATDCSIHPHCKPYRTDGLPAWQLAIIEAYPKLYRSPDWMGVSNYCHLPFGFETGPHWFRVLQELSRVGSFIVDYLRKSGLQGDAFIVITRIEESSGRLQVRYRDNLAVPFQQIWVNHLQNLIR